MAVINKTAFDDVYYAKLGASQREIAWAKAALKKAKKPNIDWTDPEQAAKAIKKYPAPAEK